MPDAVARFFRWLFGRPAPLELPTLREHASMMRLLDRRLREAQRVGEEIAAWPTPLAVIKYACGTGPAVVYLEPPTPAPVGGLAPLGGFGMTMEELAAGLHAIIGAASAGEEVFGELADAVAATA